MIRERNIRKAGILAAAMVLAVVTACGAAFDFETASEAEQEAWLRPKVEQYAKGFKAGLNRGMTKFDVDEPKIDLKARTVTLVARAQRAGRGQATGRQKRQLMEQMCPRYLRTSMYHNDIELRHYVRHKGGATIVSLKIAPSDCEIVVERMKRERANEQERKRTS